MEKQMLPYFEAYRKLKCITAYERGTGKKLYQLRLLHNGMVRLFGEWAPTTEVTKYCNQMPVELQNLILSLM